MTPIRILPVFLAFAALALLSACDTVEERAEKHYESGVELIAEGDLQRGLIELRNTLQLNEFHSEGRELYASTLRKIGNIAESYRQYTRIVEDNADNLSARLALAEMAISARNWPEVERHGAALIQANAELPGADLVALTLRFREALQSDDEALVAEITQEAVALTATYPDHATLRQIAIEGLSRQGDLRGAETQIDEALRIDPDDKRLYQMKAAILIEFNETDELEALLRDMVARFPDDPELKVSLVRLLTGRGDIEAAEAFLRGDIEKEDAANEDFVALITYIREARGPEAALAELERLIPVVPSARTGFLNAMKSAILYETGQRDAGIALLQSVIDGAEASAETDRYKVSLSRMLLGAGNEVGARQLVGAVLERDPSNVEAIKLNAAWLIESDQAEEAIVQLRRALDQEPEDAETMTLMSNAHRRLGDVELARDLLSLAVEASNNAPEESLRFAGVLIADGSLRPAEDVLLNALRATPGDRAILAALGSVYLDMEEWERAGTVEATLRRDETEESARVADRLRLQILTRQAGSSQAIAFLESLAEQEETANFARLGILQARLQAGNADGALEIAEDLVAEFPESANALLILGNTQLAARQFEGAEATFRQIAEANPTAELAWIQLMRVQGAQGRREDAEATLDTALAASPDSPNLLWAKATFLEQANDIDGAIDIYEALYARDSNSLVVANNLASLLSTYREDEESLERAFAVGRRLRGSTVPHFQDTFGWLLYRRGDFEEAIAYLGPAARALRNDPIVQYHAAMAYSALEQRERAIELFERAIELAPQDDPRPQVARARTELERLTAAQANEQP